MTIAPDPAMASREKPYFEVLVVDDLTPEGEASLKTHLEAMRGADDE